MTLMNVFESVSPHFATVQGYQVQGTLSVNMLLHVRKITPQPREKTNTKPRLTNLKLTVETTQCCSYGIVETGKCEMGTPRDKLKVPTEHALEGCVWWLVLPLVSLVEPVQVCEWDQSCFYKEIICKIVYKNISVRITRSEVQVYIWCHSTWGILTSFEVAAGAVPRHPVQCYVEQSSGEHPHTCSCQLPT